MLGTNDFKHGFKVKAEKICISIRMDMNLSKTDPLDAILLAEYLDIPLFCLEDAFENCINKQALKILISSGKFNAVLMPNADGDKIIIHNTHHSRKRQQSNLMHEIAHFLLKHEINPETARIAQQYGIKYIDTLHENEAKYLGGCLQISRPALLLAAQTMNEFQMAEYFNASNEMVRYRLRMTGVLKQLNHRKI